MLRECCGLLRECCGLLRDCCEKVRDCCGLLWTDKAWRSASQGRGKFWNKNKMFQIAKITTHTQTHQTQHQQNRCEVPCTAGDGALSGVAMFAICCDVSPSSASDRGFSIMRTLNAMRPDPCPLWCPRRGATNPPELLVKSHVCGTKFEWRPGFCSAFRAESESGLGSGVCETRVVRLFASCC
jgi:hypothetical protein